MEKECKLSNQNMIETGQIEVSVSGTFKTEHDFKAGESSLGSLAIKGAKGEGVFTAASGIVLEFKKPSGWKNQYQLLESNNLLSSVQLPNKIRKAFEIEFSGQVYELSPGGSKNRSWTLRNSQALQVCEILPRGGLKRGAVIQVENQLALQLLVLVYYLVEKRWKDEASASADF